MGGGSWSNGSPAHAGMDPVALAAQAARGRLPRPRGDGPFAGYRRTQFPPAPPPTRGWTAQRGDPGRHVHGSPAHAGMDPRGSRARASRQRLPRPRGDGPRGGDGSRGLQRAPPPTRGWTAVRKIRRNKRSETRVRSIALHPGNWLPVRENPAGSGHGRCGTAASGEFAVLDLANDLANQAASLERVAEIDGAATPQGGQGGAEPILSAFKAAECGCGRGEEAQRVQKPLGSSPAEGLSTVETAQMAGSRSSRRAKKSRWPMASMACLTTSPDSPARTVRMYKPPDRRKRRKERRYPRFAGRQPDAPRRISLGVRMPRTVPSNGTGGESQGLHRSRLERGECRGERRMDGWRALSYIANGPGMRI